MRNLKRALSLVMAMALIVGMMVVSASAAGKDFTDADEIDHTEAVEVMVALNVISGKEDGSYYDPTGSLTRAEMAKVVAYVMNGGVEPVVGTKLVPTYSDIKGHWAEKYIEYCTSMGIIAGDGQGKFNPEGTLTAEQCAKMFLTAMGYNANVFGFTGNDWAINVGRYANEAGLYKQLGDVTPSAVITRDDAAQMAYNAIQATMMRRTWQQDMETGKLTETYALWDESLSGGYRHTLLREKFEGVIAIGYMTGYSYDSVKGVWTYTFSSDAQFGCPQLTSNDRIGNVSLKTGEDYTGFYGQQVKVIFDSTVNDVVYGVYANDSQVLADGYTGNLPSAIAASDEEIKFAGVSYKLKGAASSIPVYYNNGGTAVNQLNNLNSAYVPAGYDLAAVRLIDNNSDNKVDVVVTTPLSEMKVTYVGSSTATFEGQGVRDFEDIICYDGIAKDDRVLYTAAAYSSTGIPTYEKLTVESGTVTGVKGTNEVLVDDTWTVNVSGTTLSVGDSVEYVSLGGRLYYAKVVEYGENVNDVVLVISGGENGGTNSVSGTYVEAKLLFSDGEKQTVSVSKVNNTTAVYDDADGTDGTAGDIGSLVGRLCTYKVDNNGDYELTSVAAAGQNKVDNAGSNFAGYDGSGSVAGYNNGTVGGKTLADDAVVFVYKGTDQNIASTNDGKVYTGKEIKNTFGSSTTGAISGGPTVTANGTVASCLYSTDSNGFTYARIGLLYSSNMVVTTGNNYGYLLADAYQNKNADNKNQLNLRFWDGTQEVTATWETETSSDGFKAGAAITYDMVSETAVKNVSVVLTTDGRVNAYAGGDDLEIGGTPKKITDDTVILYVDTAETTYSKDGGTIAIGDGVHDNVRYLDGGNGLALLIVDVTNEIEAAPSYITTIANANDALSKTQNVTINGSVNTSQIEALTNFVAGKTLTVTGNVVADAVVDVPANATLVINGTLAMNASHTVTVNGTLETGSISGANYGDVAIGATGHIIYGSAASAAIVGEFESWTTVGAKITLKVDTTANAATTKWYTSVGTPDPDTSDASVNGTAAEDVEAGEAVPAGTYVYGSYGYNGSDGNVTANTTPGWYLQK